MKNIPISLVLSLYVMVIYSEKTGMVLKKIEFIDKKHCVDYGSDYDPNGKTYIAQYVEDLEGKRYYRLPQFGIETPKYLNEVKKGNFIYTKWDCLPKSET